MKTWKKPVVKVMSAEELNNYINWCKKYNLKPSDFKNFSLYLNAK